MQDDELKQAYIDSELWSRQFSTRFPEYERLADNGLRSGIPKNHPLVNDGTLSSQLTETAMRRFQNLFTGKFEVRDVAPWFVVLVNILWKRVIVPGANNDADFYTKFWNLIYRSSKYGVSHWFGFFSARSDYTGSDFNTPYIADVKLESGKTSIASSNYVWVDFYFTKLDLRNIIADAKKEEAEAKKANRDSYSTWKTALLDEYLAAGPTGKASEDQNRTEREKESAQPAVLYKLAVCFHRGHEADFITVIPSMDYKVCRRRKNENPSGKVPVGPVYAINNLENPNGKGAVESAGSTQNILDEFARSDVLAAQISLEPPTQVKGVTSSANGYKEDSIVFGPRRKWRVGNADVSVVETNTSGYAQIAERFGRYRANLMNQLGSFDTTVPSNAGNPGFSKVPAGIQNLGARTNDIDNFFIKSYTAGFKELAECLMNIYLANMSDKEELEVTEDEAEELRRAGWDIGDARKIMLNYDAMKDIKVVFTPDTPNEADDKDKEGLKEAIDMVLTNPQAIPLMQQSGMDFKLGEAYLQYLGKLKLDHPEKIMVPIQQMQPGQDGGQGEGTNVTTPEDPQALQQELQQTVEQYGVDPQTAQQVMQARRNGMPEEDIATALSQAGGQQ